MTATLAASPPVVQPAAVPTLDRAHRIAAGLWRWRFGVMAALVVLDQVTKFIVGRATNWFGYDDIGGGAHPGWLQHWNVAHPVINGLAMLAVAAVAIGGAEFIRRRLPIGGLSPWVAASGLLLIAAGSVANAADLLGTHRLLAPDHRIGVTNVLPLAGVVMSPGDLMGDTGVAMLAGGLACTLACMLVPRRSAKWLVATVVTVFVVDQTTKQTAWTGHVAHINPGGNPFTPSWVWSWWADRLIGGVLDTATAGVLVLAGVLVARRGRTRLGVGGASLMIAGAASNLLDRLGLHSLTAPGSQRGALDWLGGYNAADVAIAIGATLLIAHATRLLLSQVAPDVRIGRAHAISAAALVVAAVAGASFGFNGSGSPPVVHAAAAHFKPVTVLTAPVPFDALPLQGAPAFGHARIVVGDHFKTSINLDFTDVHGTTVSRWTCADTHQLVVAPGRWEPLWIEVRGCQERGKAIFGVAASYVAIDRHTALGLTYWQTVSVGRLTVLVGGESPDDARITAQVIVQSGYVDPVRTATRSPR